MNKEFEYLKHNDPRITPVDQLDLKKISDFFEAWGLILSGEIR